MIKHDDDYSRLLSKHIAIARSDDPNEPPAYVEFSPDNMIEFDDNRFQQYWRTKPGKEILNPATGEITIQPPYARANSGCLTMAALASSLGVGPRVCRSFLVDIGILHREVVVKNVPCLIDPRKTKPEYSHETRASEWACKMVYCHRALTADGMEFDLVTPSGIEYTKTMWTFAAVPKVIRKPKPKEIVIALLDRNPSLRPKDIVRLTGLPKTSVLRNVSAYRAAAA